MKKTIKDLDNELKQLGSTLEHILIDAKYEQYDDLSGLETDPNDPEQLFLLNECRNILYKLDSVSSAITYIHSPIAYQGRLTKQANGRYSCGGRELTCGCAVDVLVPYETYSELGCLRAKRWETGRVEHNGQDYYITGIDGDIDGMTARVRR